MRAANPDFAGRTAVTATVFEGYHSFGAKDPRGRPLTSLGFTVPPAVDTFIDTDGFGGTIPGEQISAIDVDTPVDDSTEAALRTDPLYSNLNVASQGREVFVLETEPVEDAVSFVTPLSIPFLLDDLVPRLSAAVDGDPATRTTP